MFQPGTSLETMKKRAQLLQELRAFFHARGILEVDVPAIGDATVTDVHLQALVVEGHGFLQTSPEYYMKRLLAAGSGPIYYLGKAYRREESGRRHRPEFTLLEWYCLGMDDRQLMLQVTELFGALVPQVSLVRRSYQEVFAATLGINPHLADLHQLQAAIDRILDLNSPLTSKSACLDLLFSHCVEPHLGPGITLVYDYPQEQCALARLVVDEAGFLVARRFEVYWDGMELANGYWELNAADEQRQRFNSDLQQRSDLGLPVPALDERFLAALAAGLPDCAGIALGVDRLLMCLLDCRDIREVMPFADR
jgi:lysyl-tRNA synthetase class 2